MVRGFRLGRNHARSRSAGADLFKLRLSKNVKRVTSTPVPGLGLDRRGQGWEGMDSTLALTGWEDKRRVVVRRAACR